MKLVSDYSIKNSKTKLPTLPTIRGCIKLFLFILEHPFKTRYYTRKNGEITKNDTDLKRYYSKLIVFQWIYPLTISKKTVYIPSSYSPDMGITIQCIQKLKRIYEIITSNESMKLYYPKGNTSDQLQLLYRKHEERIKYNFGLKSRFKNEQFLQKFIKIINQKIKILRLEQKKIDKIKLGLKKVECYLIKQRLILMDQRFDILEQKNYSNSSKRKKIEKAINAVDAEINSAYNEVLRIRTETDERYHSSMSYYLEFLLIFEWFLVQYEKSTRLNFPKEIDPQRFCDFLDQEYSNDKKYFSSLISHKKSTMERIRIFNNVLLHGKKTASENLGISMKNVKKMLEPIQNKFGEPDISKIRDACNIESNRQVEIPSNSDIENLCYLYNFKHATNEKR